MVGPELRFDCTLTQRKIPLPCLELATRQGGFSHPSPRADCHSKSGDTKQPLGGGVCKEEGVTGGNWFGKGSPFSPVPVTVYSISLPQKAAVSASLQARSVEQRIPFPTLYSEPARSQQGKQSLELYLALARPVMQEGARCFVTGGAAQTGAGLQLLQFGV